MTDHDRIPGPFTRTLHTSRAFLRLLGSRGGLAQLGFWRSAAYRRPVDGAGRPVPWLSRTATETLEQLVRPGVSVLELGAGSSTLWWAERGHDVTSIEASPEWAARVREAAGPSARIVELPSPAALPDLLAEMGAAGARFDIVVSDGIEPRPPGIRAALPLLAAGGLLMIDNSDRPDISAEVESLVHDGWFALRIFGLVPTHGVAHETAFLSREPLRPDGRTSPRPLPSR